MSASLSNVQIIRIRNPFDPRDHAVMMEEWAAKKSIHEYVGGLLAVEHVVSINGKLIPQDEHEVTYPEPGDSVVMCPVPQAGGGGGGKGILRIVMMIVVAIASVYTGGAVGAAYGAAAGAAAAAGVTIAGTLLVNALLPPAKPPASATGGGGANSTSFGIDGAKNTSSENIAVPVCYGTHRMGGNIVNLYTLNVDSQTQELYMLINAGEGPVYGIDGIEINEQPIENFKDVSVQVNLGYSWQEPIGWFASTTTPTTQSLKLSEDWVTRTTTGEVDQLRFDFVAPQGLLRFDDKNNKLSQGVNMEVQLRKQGGDWFSAPGNVRQIGARWVYHYQNWPNVVEPGQPEVVTYEKFGNVAWDDDPYSSYSDRPPVAGQVRRIGWVDWHYGASDTPPTYVDAGYAVGEAIYTQDIYMEDSKSAAVRMSLTTPQLEEGIYDWRVRRTSPDSTDERVIDDVYVADVNEIVLDRVAYKHTAQVALRIRLTDQLNSVPRVTYLNRGIVTKVWDDQFKIWASGGWNGNRNNNPAWVAFDMLTNKRYGAGMDESRLDIEMFKEWARHCNQAGLAFDAVFDTTTNLWDAIQLVCRAGHAQLVPVGTRWSVVIERAAEPVMMFSVANIVKGTFKQNWLSMSDRANEVEVTFNDAADTYKPRTIRVTDKVAAQLGQTPRSTQVEMVGVTSYAQAVREGRFILNLNRHIQQTVEFAVPIEALACAIGDLVYVQHDMPQWGYSGRLESGSTPAQINLDRNVQMIPGKSYKLLTVQDAVMRHTGTVGSVVGSTITGSEVVQLGYSRVRRLIMKKDDRQADYEVLTCYSAGASSVFTLATPADPFFVGGTFEAWDTDVIEERDVVNVANSLGTDTEVDSLIVTAPYSIAPAQFASFMFGEVGKLKKPFRIKAITANQDYRYEITAIEYNASVYNLDSEPIPTPNYSDIEAGARQATIEKTDEELYIRGNTFGSRVTVYFHSTQPTYRDSAVYASINGAPEFLVEPRATDRATVEADDGQVVTFRVVASDVLGARAPYSSAPTITHKVLGKAAPPSDVKNFTIVRRDTDLLLKWDAIQDVDAAGYDIRVGSSWDAGKEVVTQFAGNSFAHDQSEAGTYRYHIRSRDTGGRLSVGIPYAEIVLEAPGPVIGFDAVQSGDRLEFRWRHNLEPGVVEYEIREGDTWEASTAVVNLYADYYTMPAGSEGDRTFWIKAIASPGIYGTTPAFTTTKIAQPSGKNIVYERDFKAEHFPGTRLDCTENVLIGLVMDEGVPRSEYLERVDIGTFYRAQNTLFQTIGSLADDGLAWQNAHFAWNSPDAQREWIKSGNIKSIVPVFEISPETGTLRTNEVEGWQYHDSVLPVMYSGIGRQENPEFVPNQGRYLAGMRVSDVTYVQHIVDIPQLFNYSLWVRPEQLVDCVLFRMTGRTGLGTDIELRVRYSHTARKLLLEDNFGARLELPFTLTLNKPHLIAVSQGASKRTLMAAPWDGKPVSVNSNGTALGAYTRLSLY
ncbi:host specificity factor TipJ family phage tail protein [Cupriavidus campinensis]|uniref:Tip attachment protein J domain-containing protein n=1 Tax=Cupriavidus campinensis TaxID=151783 RepID=A0ABY3ETR2_9BURK|nr:host specificity factor TipJ family phage tail protein [Cupriavidus campinensis]TSP13958.1 hypothetical protein FGG12_05665 [Cupriavidus campinensis]